MTKSQMVKTLTRIMEQDDHQSMLTVSHGGTCSISFGRCRTPQRS